MQKYAQIDPEFVAHITQSCAQIQLLYLEDA